MSSNIRSVVVVGAGLAGLRTIEGLRRNGFQDRITLVGAETLAPYDRPRLSKAALREPNPQPVPLCSPQRLAELASDVRLGTRAVGIEPSDQRLLTDDGASIGYDALVIATGARPRGVTPVGEGAAVLRTNEDADALRKAVTTSGDILVVGAGFIGCEVAASLRELDVAVTLIDPLPTPLARAVGVQVGAEIARMHQRAGTELLMRVGVADARRTADQRWELELTDGSVRRATAVLLAVGISPNVEWLEGSGVAVDDGVLCDQFGRTSLRGVWAVGDVAAWWFEALQTHRRMEHWTSADNQGETVGRNILAAAEGFETVEELPYFWSDQYEAKLQALGFISAEDDVTICRSDGHRRFVALYGRGGQLRAALGVNSPRELARLRPLIAAGAPVGQARAGLEN